MLSYKVAAVLILPLISFSFIGSGSAQNVSFHLENRIINGTNTTIRYFPWQLSIRVRQTHFCGASVLTPTRALTAARCRLKSIAISSYTVLAGSTSRIGDRNSFVSEVDHFIVHPDYSRITRANDIGVVWLKSTLSFSQRIRPIGIPPQSKQIPFGVIGYVSGWGLRRWGVSSSVAPVLQYMTAEIPPLESCRQFYQNNLLPSMFCAGHGNPSPCDADFGGPLVVNRVQHGIVSGGTQCGVRGHPYLYTRVSLYTEWLQTVV